MVDYIKIIVKGMLPHILEANPLLDFYENLNLATGEIKTVNRHGKPITPFKRAFYNSLEFRIYQTGTIIILGSLHKYWNSGAHNFNDFNEVNFVEVVNDLQSKFSLEPSNCIIKCLEIGVNIQPPIPTNDILDNCFMHKTTPFEEVLNSARGRYKQVEHSQYIIKAYNKKLHFQDKFDIPLELLRFEIKYTKMEKINSWKIYTIEDLINKGLTLFKKELVREFQNIILYDITIDSKSTRINNYCNPLYWSNLLKKPTRASFYKHKNILNDLIENQSQNIKNQIIEAIEQKVDRLTGGTRIDTLDIMSTLTPYAQNPDDKYCILTNTNISMQKENSIMLSHSGLWYYYKNERKVFEQLRRRYLSKKWYNSDIKIQIREIAHNIRNTVSNQKIKQSRLYKPQQTNLLGQLNLNV